MKRAQLLLLAFFTQVPSLSDSAARPAGPHVQAMNWGRFALLKPLPRTKTASPNSTPCDVIWSNVPGVPSSIELAHPPTFAAKLEGVRVALVPIRLQKQGNWHVFNPNVSRIDVGNRVKATRLLDALGHWKRIAKLDAAARINAWIVLVDDALPFAQAAAEEALTRISRTPFGPSLNQGQVADIGYVLSEQQLPVAQLRKRLRFLGKVGGEHGANWVAKHLFTTLPGSLWPIGVRIMGRYPNPLTTSVLRHCATTQKGAIGHICRRWIGTP